MRGCKPKATFYDRPFPVHESETIPTLPATR